MPDSSAVNVSVANASPTRIARGLLLTGRVQGLGVRPAVARLAAQYGLVGTVANRLEGLQIVVEGVTSSIERFQSQLLESLPPAARVESIRATDLAITGRTAFSIDIDQEPSASLLRTEIPQDLVVCQACLAEVSTPGRRHRYPFTTCTNCGPRSSLIISMPFERERTGMALFEMCDRCRAEFVDPTDRRFHAQTIACPDCGPNLWCSDRNDQLLASRDTGLARAVQAILQGEILALRGVGGYQLICDATLESVVSRLRQRKGRGSKPLAVMVANLDEARRVAEIDNAAGQTLSSPANPIVILPARQESGLAKSVHPGLDSIGILLPSTPLHWLLLQGCRLPLIVTSGNRDGEPLAVTREDAVQQLRDVADLWLHHDRPIVQPLDDCVVRMISGRAVTIRLGRGRAPCPIPFSSAIPAIALGGHQKSAVAVQNGAQAVLGPHGGDLDGIQSRVRFVAQVERMRATYGLNDGVWIHDLHPDYFTSRWAAEQAGARIAVQHHHAHVMAGALEQGWLDRPVLGVAFDGTGYGTDGTIWGGEFLLATPASFRRVAHLRPFRLPGGEVAIREPGRVALSLLSQSLDEVTFKRQISGRQSSPVRSGQAERLLPLLNHPQFSIQTTSAGRLFDGVAALVLGIERADFEGAPAMLLEAMADSSDESFYAVRLDEGDPLQLDWRPMILSVLADCEVGLDPGRIAMRFHRGLARAIAETCRRFAPHPVILSGGVFQNRLLTELVLELLAGSSQSIGLHGQIPPNDGGLAAGQLVVGMAQFRGTGGSTPCA